MKIVSYTRSSKMDPLHTTSSRLTRSNTSNYSYPVLVIADIRKITFICPGGGTTETSVSFFHTSKTEPPCTHKIQITKKSNGTSINNNGKVSNACEQGLN